MTHVLFCPCQPGILLLHKGSSGYRFVPSKLNFVARQQTRTRPPPRPTSRPASDTVILPLANRFLNGPAGVMKGICTEITPKLMDAYRWVTAVRMSCICREKSYIFR